MVSFFQILLLTCLLFCSKLSKLLLKGCRWCGSNYKQKVIFFIGVSPKCSIKAQNVPLNFKCYPHL